LNPLLPLLPAFALGAAEPSFAKDIHPLLETYCFKCHSPEKHKGDLVLSTIASEDQARRATKIWRGALEKLDGKDMPPEKAPQPTAAELERLTTWMRTLKPPEGPPDPGRVTIRRLNRSEYDNTIRDLIGLDLHLAEAFPSDDVGEGFDNIGDVLSLPPLLLEKYLDAANQVLDKAVVIEQVDLHFAGEQLPGTHDGKPLAAKADGKARSFTAAGEAVLDLGVPAEGKFQLRIKAGAEQAGTDPANMAVKVDNEVVKEFKVTARKTSPMSFTLTLSLDKGPHRIAAIFTNPHTEAAPEPAKPAAGQASRPAAAQAKPAGKPGTRELLIDSIEVKGPPGPPITDVHKRIFIAKPGPELSRHDAARAIIEAFATRAFRRPVAKDRLEHLMKIFDLAEQQGEVFEESVKYALQAVLVSPSFLFRVEQDRPGSGPNNAYALDDWELASRLSYFLWSTMPDEELFGLARQGKLHEPKTLEQQARRMLKDPRSHALVETFAEQWLQLRSLETRQPDPKKFPEYDKPLKKAMYDEAAMFFEAVMREDRSILEFIDADYTFLNERLAKHYGISGVTGPQMRKVTLTDRNRGGVLTMAGILTITSNPTRTSPVKRGKWVLEEIVGDPPPPPPPAVGELPEQGKGSTAGLSLRQLMERHRTDPVCASCHTRMDPIGFGFENFDAIGRWRTDDEGKPIDTSGTLPGGKAFKGPAELKALFLGRKDAFARCLSEKMLIFALGRGLKDYDDVTVDAAAQALARDQYRFSTLVAQVVTSYPFRYRRAP
jgi:hypothetical protein